MELLARFELATVSQRAYARREPSDLAIEKADEAASYAEVTKISASCRYGENLELLARFELATSSLPRMRSTD